MDSFYEYELFNQNKNYLIENNNTNLDVLYCIVFVILPFTFIFINICNCFDKFRN